MGDMSEMRGIIIVVTFLGVISGLILAMPPQLLRAASVQNTQAYTVKNLLASNQTDYWYYNFSGLSNHDSGAYQIGGYWLTMGEFAPYVNGTTLTDNASRCFRLEEQDAITWLDYYYNREDALFYNNQSEKVSVQTVITIHNWFWGTDDHLSSEVLTMNYLVNHPTDLSFVIQSSRGSFELKFTYDHSAYTSPLDAYNHMHLSMIVSVDFSERATQINAWTLILGILFINTNAIQGMDQTVIWIIRLPIIACLLYLSFIFVLRVIGAVFGGGGA